MKSRFSIALGLLALATLACTFTEGGGSSLENTQKAVVYVLAESEYGVGSGSGVIYDESGLIVTNNHVIAGSPVIKVKLEGSDDFVPAQLVATSTCDDLAVIKLTGDETYPTAPLGAGSEEIKVGTKIFVVGYPLGDPVQSLTSGIVSKMETNMVDESWADLGAVIQHDAAQNPGNSGGALTTEDGRVIGITYAGRTDASGTSFAIPIDYALPIIQKLEKGDNLTYTGLQVEVLTADVAAEYGIGVEPGLFVTSVDTATAAERAGVQTGDFITSMEGIPLGDQGTLAAYCDILRSHAEGEPLSVSAIRSGSRCTGEINGSSMTCEDPTFAGGGSGGSFEYQTITDTTGRLALQLPDIWQTDVGEQVIYASEDVVAWEDSYGGTSQGGATVAGFFYSASDQGSELLGNLGVTTIDDAGVEQFINSLGYPDNCTTDGGTVDPYDDGTYVGQIAKLPCEPGVYAILISYDPNNPTFMVWIEAYVLTDDDITIINQALSTFVVTP